MWTIFKVFTEFVTILLVFYVFWPQSMWDLKLPKEGLNSQPLHWEAKS